VEGGEGTYPGLRGRGHPQAGGRAGLVHGTAHLVRVGVSARSAALPRIERVQVMRRGAVRRSKLYYLRDLAGKAARLRRSAPPWSSSGEVPTEPAHTAVIAQLRRAARPGALSTRPVPGAPGSAHRGVDEAGRGPLADRWWRLPSSSLPSGASRGWLTPAPAPERREDCSTASSRAPRHRGRRGRSRDHRPHQHPRSHPTRDAGSPRSLAVLPELVITDFVKLAGLACPQRNSSMATRAARVGRAPSWPRSRAIGSC
jgi:hypothetical protein